MLIRFNLPDGSREWVDDNELSVRFHCEDKAIGDYACFISKDRPVEGRCPDNYCREAEEQETLRDYVFANEAPLCLDFNGQGSMDLDECGKAVAFRLVPDIEGLPDLWLVIAHYWSNWCAHAWESWNGKGML